MFLMKFIGQFKIDNIVNSFASVFSLQQSLNMNLQLIQNTSSIQPKKPHQRDTYVGSLDAQTKKRHGNGTYLYQNHYFQYEGQYQYGVKNGSGKLKLKDGRIIQGTFVNNQLEGPAKITYPDGSTFVGSLKFGQKCGQGKFQSLYQSYQGEWDNNKKSGKGIYKNLSLNQTIKGQFKNDKPHGVCTLNAYNYKYSGEWKQGNKQGSGQQQSNWGNIDIQIQTKNQNGLKNKQKKYGRYEYQGQFLNNQFNGQGIYKSKSSHYIIQGQFESGLPKNYPNSYRVSFTEVLPQNQSQTGTERKQTEKNVILQNSPFEYQLQTGFKNIYIQCVYQGPQILDEIQPTPQQIQKLVKDWQNQNKKNKNPPPMPDFNQPRMKKPDPVLITQQFGRSITVTLQRQNNDTKQQMKVDYRVQIEEKRKQFERLKQEAKKTQDQDPKKKGGKKDPKNEVESKLNLYKENPKEKQKYVKLQTDNGSTCLAKFQLPDDFPQGKYELRISSSFLDFGKVEDRVIQMNVKAKQQNKKK